MLTPGIHAAYQRGVEQLSRQPAVETVARGRESQGPHCGRAALFSITGASLLDNPAVPAVAVLDDDGTVAGLVNRLIFLARYARQWGGRTFYHRRC